MIVKESERLWEEKEEKGGCWHQGQIYLHLLGGGASSSSFFSFFCGPGGVLCRDDEGQLRLKGGEGGYMKGASEKALTHLVRGYVYALVRLSLSHVMADAWPP